MIRKVFNDLSITFKLQGEKSEVDKLKDRLKYVNEKSEYILDQQET